MLFSNLSSPINNVNLFSTLTIHFIRKCKESAVYRTLFFVVFLHLELHLEYIWNYNRLFPNDDFSRDCFVTNTSSKRQFRHHILKDHPSLCRKRRDFISRYVNKNTCKNYFIYEWEWFHECTRKYLVWIWRIYTALKL